MDHLPRRLARLPRAPFDPPLDIRRAATFRSRLLGLAGLRAIPPGTGLLLTGTRSIHTFGMRFALDLLWLDRAGHVIRVDTGVRPLRVRTCRTASGVIERPTETQGTVP